MRKTCQQGALYKYWFGEHGFVDICCFDLTAFFCLLMAWVPPFFPLWPPFHTCKICICLQVPATIRLAKKALSEGKCVIIGLQSTGEARTADFVNERGTELEDFAGVHGELVLSFLCQ